MAESTIAKAYVQILPSTKGMGKELENQFSEQGDKAGKGFNLSFGKVLGGIAVGAAVKKGLEVGTEFVKGAVEGFADFEQLSGGVETLFGNTFSSIDEYAESVGKTADEVGHEWESMQNRQETVMQNASRAYETAGMSANEYMETVTGFAASLNASLGEYSWQSANYADMIISDMSDNANKMGTDIESIKNAYAGFSKGNFTMLDNLKLGYGGTKEEMERLLRTAEELEGYSEGAFSIDSFADIAEAINIIQTDLGITGTTAKEASTTISGSLGMMKSAWDNLVVGVATDGADIDGLVGNFTDSIGTFANNLMPVIVTAISGLSTLITEIAPVFAEMIPQIVTECLPPIIEAAFTVLTTLGQALIDNLPLILSIGLDIIMNLAQSLIDALPTLIPAVTEVILAIVNFLVDNIELLVDAAIELMTALAVGLVNAIPILIQKAPLIISKLIQGLLTAGAKLLEIGKQLMTKLGNGISNAVSTVVDKAKELIGKVVDAIKEKINDFLNIGKDIVTGLQNGISEGWNSLLTWFSGKIDGLKDKAKEVLKIGSPSKVFADSIGQWIPAGIAKGIESGIGQIDDAMDDVNSHMLASATVSSSYEAGRMYAAGISDNTNNDMMDLLNKYLPMVAQGNNVNVRLEGDASRLFRMTQEQANKYNKLTGQPAFA